jgi:hypothetical protein
MARQYNDPIGGTLIIPAAYASITVAPSSGGLSTTGVLAIVGEADAGADWSEEAANGELQDNAYGPDEFQAVIDKYKSGRIVDAFRAAASAAVDPAINGSFTSCIIVKTNVGTTSTAALTDLDGVAYPNLVAKAAGAVGNLIYFNVTNPTATVQPTVTATWIAPVSNAKVINLSASGTKAAAVTATTAYTPAQAQAAIHAPTVSGVTCTGGGSRAISTGAPTVIVALVSGKTASFTTNGTWPAAVAVGDSLWVPAGSSIAGAGNINVGYYQILTKNNTVITAIKLSDADKAGAVAGTVTTPGAANAAIDADLTDLVAYAPLVISYSPSTILPTAKAQAGLATTLEISEPSVVEEVFYSAGGVKATWVSTASSPYAIKGAAEVSASINVNRQSDNISETIIAGGEVALEVGCTAATATVTINATQCILNDGALTTTLNLADYPTIADLSNYINSLATWSAAPFTAILGNLSTLALDEGVFTCASYQGAKVARIKTDAYRMGLAIANSQLVEFASAPSASLPLAVPTYTYLAGGTKGATTASDFAAAIDALQQVRCNFVVPLISRDASEDIVDGQTDAASTYEIDAVNAYVKSHVHAMSTMKVKRNRQGFISKRDTFAVVSNAAANIASYRCAMVFQDVKSAVSGSVVQYQPWLGAVLAAATQAGAFYKSLVRKQVNTSGVLQAAGDWSYNYDSQVENALIAGLNPIRRAEEGGFVWVSDQTTYGKDTNNVYNSIQMVYAADTVALTTAQRMERAFVGQSVADVTAAVALSYLDGIMSDFLRLKLIATSTDAPLGYKNARIVIQGPVMRVSVEVKIAGSIYFIPIAFYVTEITQSAAGV